MFHHWIEKMENVKRTYWVAQCIQFYSTSKFEKTTSIQITLLKMLMFSSSIRYTKPKCVILFLNLYLFVIILSVWYTNYSVQRLGYECSVYLIHRTIFLYSFFVCFFDICAIASRWYIAYVSTPHSLFRIEELKRSNKQTQE